MTVQLASASSTKKPKWYLPYLILGAFNVVTVLGSLWLTHALVDRFNQSVSTNSEWASRLGAIAKARTIGGEANAPGNDVFDTRDVAKESQRLDATLHNFEAQLRSVKAEIEGNVTGDDKTVLLNYLEKIDAAMDVMVSEARAIFSFFAKGQPDKAGERMAAMDRGYAGVNQVFAELEEKIRSIQTQMFVRQHDAAASLNAYKFAIGAAIILLCIGAAFYGYRAHRKTVADADEKDRLLHSFDTVNKTMTQLVERVSQGVAQVARQLVAGNAKLAERTDAQASTMEETAASMEELSTTVKSSADHAANAKELALTASAAGQRAGAAVARVVETMSEIRASSHKVSEITGVIDGIAFQTNILALNAAVEAARAGTQGRGFAVVASEVRSLAQRAASAAKEIKGLIDDSNAKIATGSEMVGTAGGSMNETIGHIGQLNVLLSDIATASREQSVGITQVGHAITQMDSTTQQNAQLVDQVSTATASLDEQVSRILDILRQQGHDGVVLEGTHSLPPPVTPIGSTLLATMAKPATPKRGAHSTDEEWKEF